MVPLYVMKRITPLAEMAAIMFTENLAPVVLTTGVFPFGAHVVPV